MLLLCMVQQLNLPQPNLDLKQESGVSYLKCLVRNKWLVATPEEWVRQHVVTFLNELGYPNNLLKMEMPLKINTMLRRPDVVAYDSHGKPKLIVECKASSIKITQSTFEQIAQYNLKLRVPYLMVTNGLQHFYCHVNFEENSIQFIAKLPTYESL